MKQIQRNIFTIIRSLFCSHDWRIKGFGTMDNIYLTATERRCCKCKKIEYKCKNKN